MKNGGQQKCLDKALQNNKYTSLERKGVQPIEPVQKNNYQSNTYRKDLSWLHFDDKPRVQER